MIQYYLVDGFGGCPYIYRKVKAAVESKNICVVVPRYHQTAAVEGAVIYRQHMPAVITQDCDEPTEYDMADKTEVDVLQPSNIG